MLESRGCILNCHGNGNHPWWNAVGADDGIGHVVQNQSSASGDRDLGVAVFKLFIWKMRNQPAFLGPEAERGDPTGHSLQPVTGAILASRVTDAQPEVFDLLGVRSVERCDHVLDDGKEEPAPLCRLMAVLGELSNSVQDLLPVRLLA